MAADLMFTEEEMAIEEGVGYPKAYAKLCRDRSFSPYRHGPPFTFTPYALQQNEALQARDLDEMFPIIDPKAKPTAKPKIFVSLLWKQLNHLGNAGFDPAIFRVDPYGNVLYYHADSASPLAWAIDHWFPCSRGGLTVTSNLRILQWQVCKKKHYKLEFLIPWWDLQVGISINQFLSIFASSNSDFRHRAFSLLFTDGESEELNASQTVESYTFPQHFVESKEQVGLAAAAVVASRRESCDASSALKSMDINRRPRSNSPLIAARKLKPSMSKENENPDMVTTNPYQAIVMARDSLRHREETTKMQAEIQKLDDEMNGLKQKTEEEKVAIQDLELVLIKRRRRAEKCHRLAEAQSSYRAMLEKMIRDAMHQSVIYKEQVRLNQAAANALMARLEAQKAICDSAEKELHRKSKQRDELEKQVRPEWEQGRKRSRMDDTFFDGKDAKNVLYLPGNKTRIPLLKQTDDTSLRERDDKSVLYLPGIKQGTRPHKELRVFLEEEHKAFKARLSLNEERKQEIEEMEKEIVDTFSKMKTEESNRAIVVAEDEDPIEDKLQTLKIEEGGKIYNIPYPVLREPEREEDEESRKQRGKGNVEKWLQMLLENTHESTEPNADENEISRTDEMVRKLNLKYPQKDKKILRFLESQFTEDVNVYGENNQLTVQKKDEEKREEEIVEMEDGALLKDPPYKLLTEKGDADEAVCKGIGSSNSFEGALLKDPPYKLLTEKGDADEGGCKGIGSLEGERREKSGKERRLVRSESDRAFRQIPSSPSVILGMRKGVDCIRKKPLVVGEDDGDDNHVVGTNFIKSSIKTIKKAVKI